MMLEKRGSDELKVVTNDIRVGSLPSFVSRASLRGISATRFICLSLVPTSNIGIISISIIININISFLCSSGNFRT